MKEDLLHKETVLENFILGLMGMYFDAVVVEFKTFFTFFQIGSGHTVHAASNCVSHGPIFGTLARLLMFTASITPIYIRFINLRSNLFLQ